MIIINQNSVNNVVVTLTERKRIGTPIHLFEFINNTTNESFYCVSTDNSTNPYRYNRFCITHRLGTVDPSASEVNMPLTGFYFYNVFENPDSVLDPAGLTLLETGKLLVQAPQQDVVAFESDINPSLTVFNPADY